jgi:hypothetical protein
LKSSKSYRGPVSKQLDTVDIAKGRRLVCHVQSAGFNPSINNKNQTKDI